MVERIVEHMRAVFGTQDMSIFMVILLLVTLLPIVLFALRYRPLVRSTAVVLLIVYLVGNLSFTILNRETLSDYYVILPSFDNYRRALYLDLGIVGTIKEIMEEGLIEGLRHVHMRSSSALREIILNILLYFPMGYILSFVFPRKHRHIAVITLIGCLCSFATELAQLYWRIGYFHVDDIINNTLGTLAGAIAGCLLATIWRVK